MKPLPVALLTPLDAAIWLEVDARMDGEREYALHVDARQSDRRDAANMLWWARMPVYRPASWLPWAVSCNFHEVLPL